MNKYTFAIIFCLIPVFVFATVKTTPWNTTGHPTQIKVQQRAILDADVENDSGEISLYESSFKVAHDYYFNDIPLTLRLSYKHTSIDENIALELPSHLEHLSYGFGTMFPAPFVDSDQYFVGLDANVSFNTDDGSLDSSAARFPINSYVVYKYDEKLMLVAGVRMVFDYSEEVLPFIGFRYVPNEDWEINFLGPDPTITYKVNEHWSLFAEGSFSNEEYEVTRNNEEGRVLETSQFLAGVGAKYQINETMEAKISVGGAFNRQLEYEDDQGKASIDNGAYISFKFTSYF